MLRRTTQLTDTHSHSTQQSTLSSTPPPPPLLMPLSELDRRRRVPRRNQRCEDDLEQQNSFPDGGGHPRLRIDALGFHSSAAALIASHAQFARHFRSTQCALPDVLP